MKKYLLPLLLLAAPAFAAQQEITAVPDSPLLPSIGALKDAVNLRLADIDENFDEVYAVIDAGPVYVNASAPADTKVVWIDTDQSNAIKVYVGGAWTVVGSGGEGNYTLPTAAADTLGGVKVGARLTITDGVLSADVQTGDGDDLGSAAYTDVVALWTTCTGYLKSDGTCDTPSGSATYPSAAGVANWGGSAWGTSYTVGTAANNLVQLNASAQLPAVSAALLTNFPTLNQNTTGTAAGLTAQYIDWSASSGGNSIANKPTIPTASDTAYNATFWNGNTDVPTKNAVRDKIESLPSLAAGTGITITEDGGGAGIDTINVTTNTYQPFDADLTTWAGITTGTGVPTALAANADTVGGLPTIIAKGTYTVDTDSISANSCASAVAVTATGVATTDTIIATPNAILSTVAGFGVTTAGAVRVDIYPTANNVNFQFCNPTGAAIDPGSVSFNWRVLR